MSPLSHPDRLRYAPCCLLTELPCESFWTGIRVRFDEVLTGDTLLLLWTADAQDSSLCFTHRRAERRSWPSVETETKTFTQLKTFIWVKNLFPVGKQHKRCQTFKYGKITVPLSNPGNPRWWCHDAVSFW